MRHLVLAVALAALAAALLIPTASAHLGTVAVGCDSATFSYTNFGSGPNPVHEQVVVDGNVVADTTFTFSGASGTDAIALNLTGDHTVTATADWTVDGGGSAQDTETLSCGGSSGGKTFTIGPSSMEGHLTIHAGDFFNGGYSFKFKDNTHVATQYSVSATVAVPVTCPKGGGPGGTILIDLGTRTYNVPAGNTDWLPTGDQNSILSWQGSTVTPDLCGGFPMDNARGAVFTATVSQNPATGSLVDFRFKYRDPAAKGKPNTDCTNASDPNRNRADVCGASWSQTVTDP
jgi:hypothetical protein